jgi:ATP-dependent helicase HrpA
VGPLLPEEYGAVLADLVAVLTRAQEVDRRVRGLSSLALLATLSDVRAQLGSLLPDRFVTSAGAGRLRDLERYLDAVVVRLSRATDSPGRDETAMAQVHRLEDEVRDGLARLPPSARRSDAARELTWMLQELRVSLFAPTLRTAYPVSDKRIRRALAALADAG